ncbi:MAG: YggS family pyridoxal phosphate-dependent enzyme [Balneolaceae bacterium]
MNNPICNNLRRINERIQEACRKAGRDPSGIILVAVSKTKPVSDVLQAINCGQFHFGENRARELQEKMGLVKQEGVAWHFVGPMQTNKIKFMVDHVDWIQSIYKKKYLDEIEKRVAGTGRTINTLVQVNISKEDQKTGCHPRDVPDILKHAQSLEHIRVRGVMGMAAHTDNTKEIRDEFKLLKAVFEDNLHLNGGAVDMQHISMGMSHDLDIAVEEGSTMVRIGTAIFGERDYGNS